MKKHKIYLADLTHTAQDITSDYIPYGIGCIKAYFNEYSKYKEKFEIKLFRYPDVFDEAFLREKPDIVAFANYMWNTDLACAFATEIRKLDSNIFIVFGGPNYPVDEEAREKWFQKRPFVDIYVVGEGEETFRKTIDLWYETKDIQKLKLSGIDGCHSFVNQRLFKSSDIFPRLLNLDLTPSPYLDGCLDEFLEDERLIPLLQIDRGCPYNCTYCDKGTKFWTKLTKKAPAIIEKEVEYIAKKTKSKVIELANNNFGLFEQDVEIAKILARTRDKLGYPFVINTPTDKNFSDRIIECAKILGESLAIYASVQSLDPEVLNNIKRTNLSVEQFAEISKMTNATNSSTRSEVITALPGDTKEKSIKTMCQLIDSKMQFVLPYTLTLLEGAELNTKKSRDKWKMKTKFRLGRGEYGVYPFGEKRLHSAEIEEVVVGSDTMSLEDYLECRAFGLTVFIFYSDDILYELLSFLNMFGIKSSDFISAVHNRGWCYFTKELTDLYKSFEEATRNELWDNREELERYVKSLDNFEDSKIVGYNVLYTNRAIALMKLVDDIIEIAFRVAHDLLDEKALNLYSDYLSELKLYMVLKKRDFFHYNKEYVYTFNYNFDELFRNKFLSLPKKASPIDIRFFHTEKQKRQFDGFTNDLSGAVRIIPKLSLINLIRSIEIQ